MNSSPEDDARPRASTTDVTAWPRRRRGAGVEARLRHRRPTASSRPATSMPTCTVEPRYSTERADRRVSEVASIGAVPGLHGRCGRREWRRRRSPPPRRARPRPADDVVAAHEARDEGRWPACRTPRAAAPPARSCPRSSPRQVGQRHRLFLAVRDMDEGDAEPRLQRLQLGAHLDRAGTGRAPTAARRAAATCGSVISARASATRCCWPPESCAGRRVGIGLHLHQLQQLERPGAALVLVDAAHLQAEGDVVDAVEMRETARSSGTSSPCRARPAADR